MVDRGVSSEAVDGNSWPLVDEAAGMRVFQVWGEMLLCFQVRDFELDFEFEFNVGV